MPSRARTRAAPAPARPVPVHSRPRASVSGSRPGPNRTSTGRRQPSRAKSRPRLTGRGAVLVMLVVFVVTDLIAAGLHSTWLGGLGYAAGCLLAVTYARREALLLVVTTPPAIFLAALVATELVTVGGSTLLATAEGTLLTLAATAPWLLGVTIVCVAAAIMRGLPRCIQDLRTALAGQDAAESPATGS